MVRLINNRFLLLFVILLSLGNGAMIFEDPEPRVPKRVNADSEEEEAIKGSGNYKQIVPRTKEVKQNQEETDPIFYDSTVSPAEMQPDE